MKKTVHRTVPGLLFVISTLLIGIGCSKKGESEASSAPADGEIAGSLSFAAWDSNQSPGMQANIELFQQSHPNVDVQLQVTPWNE